MALKINIEDTRYENAIQQLSGHVNELDSIVAQYHALNGEVEQCYNSAETQELKKLIQEQINRLNQAIGATNLNIERFQSIKENAATTNSAISGSINSVLTEAQNLFQ